jgi:2-keto-4-pentenoate hydratase
MHVSDHKMPPSQASLTWRTQWLDALSRARRDRQPVSSDPNLAACPVQDAYQLQAENIGRTLAEIGGEVIGLKLGGTMEPILARLNLDSPFVGPIFSARTYEPAATLKRADFIACIVEAEIGVRIGRDLGHVDVLPTRDDLIAAIDSVFPAIEIADSRLRDWQQMGAAAIISDNGYAGAWIRGKDAARWQDIDLVSLPVTLRKDGEVIREGSGAIVLGDPLRALGMLVSSLRQRGQILRAGTLVSTGSCIMPFPSPDGGHFVADFGPLGSVAMDLA